MKRILVATVAVLGLSGIAAAQEAPQLIGNLSANVQNAYNRGDAVKAPNVDRTVTTSVGKRPFTFGLGQAEIGSGGYFDPRTDDRYSGR